MCFCLAFGEPHLCWIRQAKWEHDVIVTKWEGQAKNVNDFSPRSTPRSTYLITRTRFQGAARPCIQHRLTPHNPCKVLSVGECIPSEPQFTHNSPSGMCLQYISRGGCRINFSILA